ncbi:MAG: hypothetical protein M5U34_25875 [Chloroflexi bacterium]|nr:hypothetical protein [Chloroflexota bacterium]
MQPYPAYKDSTAPWFGDVPESWDVIRLGAVLRERGEKNDGTKTENVLSVLKDIGVINYEDKGAIGNKKSEDIERYKPMDNLNGSILGNLKVPVPPIQEQQQIIYSCQEKTAVINAVIERTQREIELIEEYRTTLIAHAVTGKIDIRSVV